MARSSTKSRKRATPPARRPASSAEDLMFFPKLRRKAKWVFAFIALAFGLSFVVAGVGSGFGSGIGDYLSELFNRQPGTDVNFGAPEPVTFTMTTSEWLWSSESTTVNSTLCAPGVLKVVSICAVVPRTVLPCVQ